MKDVDTTASGRPAGGFLAQPERERTGTTLNTLRKASISELFAVFWIGNLCLVVTTLFANVYVMRCPDSGAGTGLLDGMCRWDGWSYISILNEGYRYDKGTPERIAFFPVYPMLGKAMHLVTRLSPRMSLLVMSWASFAGALWLLGRYPPTGGKSAHIWPAVAAAAVPAGFFFRMAYTESTCLLLLIATVYVVRTGRPLLVAALLAGACSGTRSVGIAALPVVLLYIVEQRKNWGWTLGRLLLYAPVAVWGVLAFAAYQGIRYHDPLAFVKIQDAYRMRPHIDASARIIKLLTFEPLRAAYNLRSEGFWGRLPLSADNPEAVFNIQFWNPIYFAAAVGLVVLGGALRWLGRYELTLAAGLLAIPYVTRGYDFGMCSQARFATVCFPVYLVLGRLLAALPQAWRVMLVLLASLQMCMWAALFAAGYPLF